MLTHMRSLDHRRRVLAAVNYLFRATFSGGAQAAPLPSPLACDLGSLTVTDTENKLSIASGALLFNGGKASPAVGDPAVWSGASFARVAGRALLVDWTIGATTTYAGIGWDSNQSGGMGALNYLDIRNNGAGTLGASGTCKIGTFAAGTAYKAAVILRAAGAFWVIKGGAFTDWTLLYVDNSVTTSPLFAAAYSRDSVLTLDNLRVVDLGGAWASAYGIATSRLSNPGALATCVHVADAVAEWTFVGSNAENRVLRYRKVDDQNYWAVSAGADGSLTLYEMYQNTLTARGSAAGVIANGTTYRVVVTAVGNVHTVWLDNVQKIAYTDASNLFVTATTAQVGATPGATSEVVCWPRTLTLPAV